MLLMRLIIILHFRFTLHSLPCCLHIEDSQALWLQGSISRILSSRIAGVGVGAVNDTSRIRVISFHSSLSGGSLQVVWCSSVECPYSSWGNSHNPLWSRCGYKLALNRRRFINYGILLIKRLSNYCTCVVSVPPIM